MTEMCTNFNHTIIEQKWRQYWNEKKIYKWNDKIARKHTFVVDTPPPTVSGQLHMGHIFSYTQADFMVRYHRMLGKNIFFPVGFDDNGLPTERLVEKIKNVRAKDIIKTDFIKMCQEVVAAEEANFRQLFNAIGLSVDWSLEYQTINPLVRKISQMSFIDLCNEGQVYRSYQPVLWDCVDQTALSQADVEEKERASIMHYIPFTTKHNQEKLEIATTRPEMLPACCAVFFHPNDARYQHLHNQYAITPLFGAIVPILADETVSMDKGSGLVMCCTFGDTKDVAWWKKHKLATRMIISSNGKIKPLDFPVDSYDFNKFQQNYAQITGLTTSKARTRTIELLQQQNLILKQEEIIQTTKHAERSGAALEIIMTPQWFIKVVEHKEALLQKAEELQWYPESMKVRLVNWINALSWDWCISRQRYFGVPLPVWYSKRQGEEGKIILPDIAQLPIDPVQDLPAGYTRDEVEADHDVMDTWATSSLTPQLSSHGISKNLSVNQERHNQLFPADLRPQAHEIIRTWAFYTMVKSYLHQCTLPWSKIMISGWCLADDRKKMSKSKGNIIEPAELIQQYGADVVRYWASTAQLGYDCALSEQVLKIGKKLVNKMWNASRFVLLHITGNLAPSNITSVKDNIHNSIITHSTDLWMLDKLYDLIKNVSHLFNNYEYAIARMQIEDFFLKEFCDNYLELIKVRIYGNGTKDNVGHTSALYSVFWGLKTILELFAPFLPYITEELYDIVHQANQIPCISIHTNNTWPQIQNFYKDACALSSGNLVTDILSSVRKSKSERALSIKAPIVRVEVIMPIDKYNFNHNNHDYTQLLPIDIITDLKAATNSREFAIVNDFTTNGYIVRSDKIIVNVIHTEAEENK